MISQCFTTPAWRVCVTAEHAGSVGVGGVRQQDQRWYLRPLEDCQDELRQKYENIG